MASVRVYGSMNSQPVRMVMDVCKIAEIAVEFVKFEKGKIE